jgi:hypothetical protein
VLSQFDTQADEFAPQRVQDELIGQMSELLGIDYDVLALDLTESESRHRALVSDPTPPRRRRRCLSRRHAAPASIVHPSLQRRLHPPALRPTARESDTGQRRPASPAAGDLLLEHIVSPAPTTERLQSIQRMVADQLGDALPPDFSASVCSPSRCRPAGSIRSPTSGTSTPAWTRPIAAHPHRAVRARDRGEADLDECIEDRQMASASPAVPRPSPSPLGRAVLALLACLAGQQPADVGWMAGSSSSTCRRCCTARATAPGD